MSAFVVSGATMHRVLYAIAKTDRPFVDMATRDCAALDRIGRKLLALNAAAVAVRYGEPVELTGANYQYRPQGHTCTDILQIKAVDCLLYQMAEGDIPERPEYTALAEIADGLRRKIVANLPEYQAAAWDA